MLQHTTLNFSLFRVQKAFLSSIITSLSFDSRLSMPGPLQEFNSGVFFAWALLWQEHRKA